MLTEDGQEIFAENSAAQGQKNHVTSNRPFPFVSWLKSTDRIYSVTRGRYNAVGRNWGLELLLLYCDLGQTTLPPTYISHVIYKMEMIKVSIS